MTSRHIPEEASFRLKIRLFFSWFTDVSAALGIPLGGLPANNTCVFRTGDVNQDNIIDVNDVLPV